MAPRTDFLRTILTEKQYQEVSDCLGSYSSQENLELEASVSISLASYSRLCKEYARELDDDRIDGSDVLDVIFGYASGSNYRFSVSDEDVIDEILSSMKKRRPEDIRAYLVRMMSEGKNIVLQEKKHRGVINISDYEFRVKCSPEIDMEPSQLLPIRGDEKIMYRHKSRYTFKYPKHVIELTEVKQSATLWDLTSKPSKYEAEMELTDRKVSMKTLGGFIEDLLKRVHSTQVVIGRPEKEMVVQRYREISRSQVRSASYRVQVSMDIPHVKLIPNKYVVISKLDGQRYLLIILEEGVYLIDSNLNVRKTLVETKKHHGAILDGELIKINGKEVYMAFDIISNGKTRFTQNKGHNTLERIQALNTILEETFTLLPFSDYESKHQEMDLNAIIKFYSKELDRYWKKLRSAVEKSEELMITRNLYLIPYGVDPSEVFAYGNLLWKKSTLENKAPYILDGIIYTPIDISYDGSKELDSSSTEFKWKAPSHNSIDFYVDYLKDSQGVERIFFDESGSNPYKAMQLFVGRSDRLQEYPTPFKIGNKSAIANVYLTDDECRTQEGDIIMDKCVVEFTYDTQLMNVEDPFRWSPMRIRFDKTESVQRYKRLYGNNSNIAHRIWKTITNPVTEDDIAALGNPSSFETQLRLMSERRGSDQAYYQRPDAGSQEMRSFNNWIKTNLISMYVDPESKVLDIGCGRGGDIQKYAAAGVSLCVGVDIDHKGLFVIHDCAINRYRESREKARAKGINYPPMTFIQADARALFTPENQTRTGVLPALSAKHQGLLTKYLSGDIKYDSISVQFNIHYYLGEESSWANFCQNINTTLVDNGFLIVTAFDGGVVERKLKGRKNFSVEYVNDAGKKVPYFDIKKAYGEETSGLGMGIDLYNSLISDQGVYHREYLVIPEYLISQLRERCQLELVDTDNFYNIFKTYQGFFERSTNRNHEKIKRFYESVSQAKPGSLDYASFMFCIMNRYYVFQKRGPLASEPRRIPPLSNLIPLGNYLTPQLAGTQMVVDQDNADRSLKKVYRFIRKELEETPHVYVLHHQEEEVILGGSRVRHQGISLSKVREGGSRFCLIYRSPEKIYHPIYLRIEEPLNAMRQVRGETSRRYALRSKKIVDDLDCVAQMHR